MRVLVYTANVGNYDDPVGHINQSMPFEYQCFSDPIEGLTNSKASRWYKTHPPQDFDMTIYLDANIRIKSNAFVQWCMNQGEFSVFTHPSRNCLYDEADVCKDMRKCLDEPIREQAQHYRAEGMPEHFGLWVGSIIVRKKGETISEAWWTEIEKWSGRDQISLPYVFWKQNKRPNEFPCLFPSNMVSTKISSAAHAQGYEQCPR